MPQNAQGFIPGSMPSFVIDSLEVIRIQNHQNSTRQTSPYRIQEIATVEYAGKSIELDLFVDHSDCFMQHSHHGHGKVSHWRSDNERYQEGDCYSKHNRGTRHAWHR